VDDEAISRRAVTFALEKARLKSVSVEDPNQAFKMITENRFDLVFLDVDMPGMNGFELCAKLRALPAYKQTPVIFVTSLNDFESRANSTMSGGNDFIAKPFLFIELAVKALVHVLKSRVDAKR
jgi:sigma-B regulation protein RsbU (phosphoserine phosphatase)